MCELTHPSMGALTYPKTHVTSVKLHPKTCEKLHQKMPALTCALMGAYIHTQTRALILTKMCKIESKNASQITSKNKSAKASKNVCAYACEILFKVSENASSNMRKIVSLMGALTCVLTHAKWHSKMCAK